MNQLEELKIINSYLVYARENQPIAFYLEGINEKTGKLEKREFSIVSTPVSDNEISIATAYQMAAAILRNHELKPLVQLNLQNDKDASLWSMLQASKTDQFTPSRTSQMDVSALDGLANQASSGMASRIAKNAGGLMPAVPAKKTFRARFADFNARMKQNHPTLSKGIKITSVGLAVAIALGTGSYIWGKTRTNKDNSSRGRIPTPTSSSQSQEVKPKEIKPLDYSKLDVEQLFELDAILRKQEVGEKTLAYQFSDYVTSDLATKIQKDDVDDQGKRMAFSYNEAMLLYLAGRDYVRNDVDKVNHENALSPKDLKEIFGDYRFTFPENSVELEDLFTRVFTMYTRLTERSGIFDKYITDTKVLEQYHKFEDLVIRYNKATTREEQQNVVKESLALIREIYPITTSERTNSTSPRNLSPEMIYFRPIVQFLTTTQYANNFGLTKEEKELFDVESGCFEAFSRLQSMESDMEEIDFKNEPFNYDEISKDLDAFATKYDLDFEVVSTNIKITPTSQLAGPVFTTSSNSTTTTLVEEQYQEYYHLEDLYEEFLTRGREMIKENAGFDPEVEPEKAMYVTVDKYIKPVYNNTNTSTQKTQTVKEVVEKGTKEYDQAVKKAESGKTEKQKEEERQEIHEEIDIRNNPNYNEYYTEFGNRLYDEILDSCIASDEEISTSEAKEFASMIKSDLLSEISDSFSSKSNDYKAAVQGVKDRYDLFVRNVRKNGIYTNAISSYNQYVKAHEEADRYNEKVENGEIDGKVTYDPEFKYLENNNKTNSSSSSSSSQEAIVPPSISKDENTNSTSSSTMITDPDDPAKRPVFTNNARAVSEQTVEEIINYMADQESVINQENSEELSKTR